MLRIKYTMGIAALLLLQASSSFAAERDHQVILAPNGESIGIVQSASDQIYRTAASKIQGQGDQLAATDAALQQQADQSERASNAMTMEYPALALLAMAIISIAALSRRDSLRIDR
jgi:hypothetical protein